MTPLHWACYNDDKKLVEYMLENGAKSLLSHASSMPIDIAGFMGNRDVIKVFMAHAVNQMVEKGLVTNIPGKQNYDTNAANTAPAGTPTLREVIDEEKKKMGDQKTEKG